MIDRDADLMKQGCMKRLPKPKGTAVSRQIAVLKAALAGKKGYQSAWAIDLMRHELKALRSI